MSLLVVGSVALDTIQTPYGIVRRVPGGSALYFAYAASFFGPVRLVSIVGQDFPKTHLILLQSRQIDLAGLKRAQGKTFSWHGRYEQTMSAAQTLQVHLHTFDDFQPHLPPTYQDSRYVFLANGSPHLQREVLHQLTRPRLVLADTMNFWIKHQKPALLKLIPEIDGLIVNHDEVRQLTGKYHLLSAAREILKWGPRLIIIKKGEHGALLITRKDFFAIPGYPVEIVKDPTGAGDSFAGGMMGYLAQGQDLSFRNLKRALIYGNVVASFTVEDFGLRRLKKLTRSEITQRYQHLIRMLNV